MATVYVSRARRRRRAAARTSLVLVMVTAVTGTWLAHAITSAHRSGVDDRVSATSLSWPDHGEAAVAVGAGSVRFVGGARALPIASLAKVMTALVVLHAHPLDDHDDGPSFVITGTDVADTAVRRDQGQSVVAIAEGEHLTERQALAAILLPSANNVAALVARAVGGTAAAFVTRMNSEARQLRMTDTRYTDPSGFDPATVSTARDQVLLARAAMRVAAFARIVGMAQVRLPVAGQVVNTDSLIGRDGFVGIKTGSDNAAGGCFMFAVRYVNDGRPATLFGAVLGQRDGPLIAAALRAGHRLAGSITAVPGPGRAQ